MIGAAGRGNSSGAAYVFVRDAQGQWSQQARLVPAQSAAGVKFGRRVALDGDSALIGEFEFRYDLSADGGTAHVFTRDANGRWSQQSTLAPSDGAPNDAFGRALALDGDTALIGAYDNVINRRPGSAYIFGRDANGLWTERQQLQPADVTPYDLFGVSVALEGDSAVVGSSRDDSFTRDAGSFYTFSRDSASDLWQLQAENFSSGTDPADRLGGSMALDGDTLLVTASDDDDNGLNAGAVYVFSLVREGPVDRDEDGVIDRLDNCPRTYNPLQENLDGDSAGDVCDEDDDGDGVNDKYDNCPVTVNGDQSDGDGDGVGDACDKSDVPSCEGVPATVYVEGGRIVGGAYAGLPYRGVLMGGRGNDVIVGTDKGELIVGRRGADLVCAGGGSDKVYGGKGADRLYGESGRDTLIGNRGSDALSGGKGNDRLFGGLGRDRGDGGGGKNRCVSIERSRHCP